MLHEPSVHIKEHYVVQLKKRLFANKECRNDVVEAFKASHPNLPLPTLTALLTKMVCEIASKQLLNNALQLRKYQTAIFLNSIKSVKLIKIDSHDDFGDRCHTDSSEPYFYESAYLHNKCDTVFPINSRGQVVVSDVYLVNNPGKQNSNLPEDQKKKHKEWKCSFQCRPITQSEIDSIIALRLAFDVPVKNLRSFWTHVMMSVLMDITLKSALRLLSTQLIVS